MSVTRPGKFGNPFRTASAFEAWLNTGEVNVTHLLNSNIGASHPVIFAKNLQERRRVILARLPELRGKQLMCFCSLGCACHGDVLARMANRVSEKISVSHEAFVLEGTEAVRRAIVSVFDKCRIEKCCTVENVTVQSEIDEATQMMNVTVDMDTLPNPMPNVEPVAPEFNGTLGAYRDLAAVLFGETSKSVGMRRSSRTSLR